MNKKFISLVAAVKALVKSEAALDKAKLGFYEQQGALKVAFMQALCDLHGDYSTEAASTLVKVIEPLGANRVNGLLASRLYGDDTYTSLDQLVKINFDKELISFTKQCSVEALQAFEKAENGLTSPKPAAGFTKAGTKAEAATLATVGTAMPAAIKTKVKVELTEAQTSAKRIKAALASLEKEFTLNNQGELLALLSMLEPKANAFATKLNAQDVIALPEDEEKAA